MVIIVLVIAIGVTITLIIVRDKKATPKDTANYEAAKDTDRATTRNDDATPGKIPDNRNNDLEMQRKPTPTPSP